MDSQSALAPIGIFDSGIGGISVLREAVHLLPQERFVFYGDTKNAPYGTKSRVEVLSLVKNVAQHLLAQQVKAIVIACNTATSIAASSLREEYALPIIGMEPALKPASLLHKDGIILSLATPNTIHGEKYASLIAHYGEGVVSLPCPGLMEFAERGEMDSPALHRYLSALFHPYASQKVEAIVLGCTHYVFLKSAIAKHFPAVPLIDGNAGTVRQLIHRLQEKQLLAPLDVVGGVTFQSSCSAEALSLMQALFALPYTK